MRHANDVSISRAFCAFALLASLPVFAQSPDETADQNHFFPLVANGDGFQTHLFLTNTANAANRCELSLRGAGLGAGIFEPGDAVTPAGAGAVVDLPATGRSLALATTGERELRFGYAKLDCAEPVVARMLLSLRVNGSIAAMTTLENAQSARAFQFPALPRLGRLGLLFANDSALEASCDVELESGQGAAAGGAPATIPARASSLHFLDELIEIPRGLATGTVAISCTRAIAALGLPFGGPAFTALSALALDGDNPAAASQFLPLVIDGDGFRSQLLVTNLAETGNRCTIDLRGTRLGASRFEAPAGASVSGSRIGLELAAKGDQASLPSTGARALAFGYATIECDRAAAALNLLTAGARVNPPGMAAVPAVRAAGGFEFPVLPAADRGMVLVFSNDADADASCAIELTDHAGAAAGRRTVDVVSKLTAVRFLGDLFDGGLEDFPGGTAAVACDRAVNAISLPLSGTIFAALPPAIVSASALAPEPGPDFGNLGSPLFEQYTIGEPIEPLRLPAAGGGKPPLNYSLEPAVPGLRFDSATRVLNGTPTAAGEYDMTYRVEDANGEFDFHEFGILVTEANSTPRFAGASAPQDRTYTLGAEIDPLELPAAIGGDAPLTYFLDAQIPGLYFDDATRRLSGAPSRTGVYEMRYVVEDADFESDTLEFTITVTVPVTSGSLLEAGGCADGAFVDNPDANGGLVADCRALVGFANALIETGLIAEDNVIRQWGKGDREKLDAWEGIGVSGGRVSGLNLENRALQGGLPPNLGQLDALTELILFGNGLTGPIPAELVQLSRLRILELGGNALTGVIPPGLGQLRELEILGLRENELTGSIPAELPQLGRLRRLDLGANRLAGAIPPELGQLRNLEYLGLWLNELTGPIPAELAQLGRLRRLDLAVNRLEGAIPAELAQLDRLQELELAQNELTGPIPAELAALSGLRNLDLSGNNLTGPVPPELGRLSGLESLRLGFNRLTGTLPVELATPPRLEVLDLAFNRLRGDIPWEYRERMLSREFRVLIDGTQIRGFAPPPERRGNPVWSPQASSNGNAAHHSFTWFQGPKVLEWDWEGERVEYQTPILGRWAALAVRIDHAVEEPPRVVTRVLDSRDAVLAESLELADRPATREIGSGQWRSEFVFHLPGELFQAGNRIVHVIDPQNELAETDETDNTGEPIIIYGDPAPRFRAVFIPVRNSEEDAWYEDLDPDSLMAGTHALLPIADDFEARVGPVHESEGEHVADILLELLVQWNVEADADEFYHGLVNRPDSGGIALLGDQVAVSAISIHDIVPHEFGHNLGLEHAPGCGANFADENYPWPNGQLGPEDRGWQLNWRRFVARDDGDHIDLMSYCDASLFISGYNYSRAAEYWLSFRSEFSGFDGRELTASTAFGEEGAADAESVQTTSTERAASLALSGRIGAGGGWSLTQAQLSDRAPRPAAEDGEFTLVLFDGAGARVYAEPLAVMEVSEGDEMFWAARTPLPPRAAREIAIVDARGNEVLRQALPDLE